MVGPGALKPTVGDGKKSSRLLVHIVIDILLFCCAPILVCVIIIIIIISCRVLGFVRDIERCPTRRVPAVNGHARRRGSYPARRRSSYPARRLGSYPTRRLVVPAGAHCYADCIFFRSWLHPTVHSPHIHCVRGAGFRELLTSSVDCGGV